MSIWSADSLRTVVDDAPEGIVVCEVRGRDHPLIYANRAFSELTGYARDELLGADLRSLQGEDREQSGRSLLRLALAAGASGRALLRNYRKDGSQLWNEVIIQPVRDDAGTVTHFVGFHRDVGKGHRALIATAADALPAPANEELEATSIHALPRWQREDRVSGLHSRAYFEELLQKQWEQALRERRALALVMFDIHALGTYNDTFGRAGGDACIRRVARVLGASFRRGADVLARWNGGTFVVLAQSGQLAPLIAYAETVAQRVLELQIHHPRAIRQRFVTLGTGAASLLPTPGSHAHLLIDAVTQALQTARSERAGQLIAGS